VKLKNKEFLQNFGARDIFINFLISKISGKYSLDVVKFNKWLEDHHGYDIKVHGSTHDFILLRFGEKGVEFIKSLLK